MKVIKDDEGADRPAPTFVAGVCPDPDHPATRAMVARIGEEMFGGSRGWTVMIVYSLVAPVLVVLSCFGAGIVGTMINSPFVSLMVAIALLIGGSWLLTRLLTPDATAPFAHGFRHVGRCGSCGHSLSGAPSVEGTTRCAECGAAWRSDSIREMHVPDADAFGARRLRKAIDRLRTPSLRLRDARGRYVRLQLPKRRWMRGTPLASAAWRVRWVVIAIHAGIGAVVAVAVIALAATQPRSMILLLLPLALVVTILSAVFLPRLQLALLRRAGICPACSNALDEARGCPACMAQWGTPLPPPLGPARL
jgi:hypothetical protein